MPTTRGLLLFSAVSLFSGGAFAETAALPSVALTWEEIEARPTSDSGRSRSLFRSPTTTLDELEIHVTTLPAGEASHAPHVHPEEEVIIVKEGELEVYQAGRTRVVGPGAVLFMASQEPHAVKNVGATPATYHVMQWFSPGMKSSATGCVQAQAAAASAPAPAFPGQWAPSPADWRYPVWPKGCGRFEGAERASCLEFVALDFGRLSRFAAANAALSRPKPGETRAVFFGDSITDGWSRPESGGFFPGRPYVNRGIGGQTTSQMLVRFRPDVIALEPRAVVILAGTNDVAGNSGDVAVESIQDNLSSMAELARAHAIKVVLASLLPVSDDKKDANGQPLTRTRQRPTAILKALNRWLSDYAARNGHVYLDYFAAMADESGLLRPELNDDGLHPNARGYAVMAPLAERALARALKAGS